MQLKDLDLNLLVALDALLTQRNVTRAADQVYVCQSAMSHALARLRRSLGDQIVVRRGNQLELTPRGESLVEPVRDILMRVSALLEPTDEFVPEASTQEFVVSMTEYTTALLLPGIMARLARDAPGVRLTVLDQAIDADLSLANNAVHLAITHPMRVCYPSRALFRDEYAWVVHESHPTAHGALDPQRLADTAQVVCAPSSSQCDQPFDVALMRLGVGRDVPFRVASLAGIGYALHASDVAALVPRLFKPFLWRSEELRSVDLPIKLPEIEPTMYWHQLRTNDPSHRWLRKVITSASRELRAVAPTTEHAEVHDIAV